LLRSGSEFKGSRFWAQRFLPPSQTSNLPIVAIAESLKSQSDAYEPLTDKIIRFAEDFDFESITKLVSALEVK